MTNEQIKTLLSTLTGADRQKIQNIVDNRLKSAIVINGAKSATYMFDLSFELAREMQTKCFFLGGQTPPKN